MRRAAVAELAYQKLLKSLHHIRSYNHFCAVTSLLQISLYRILPEMFPVTHTRGVVNRREWISGTVAIGLLPIRCIALQKRAVQFTKKPYLPLFLSETADTFAREYAIKKSFRHALHLVTAYLHRQNQVAHALRTRDFLVSELKYRFPNTFRTARARVSRNLN